MIRSDAKIFLLKEFNTNFDNTIPIAYTNRNDFYFTTGVKTTKPTNGPWVRLLIENYNSLQATMGPTSGRRFERMGMISAQVFIQQNTGTYSGELLCEEIINIFEGKRFGQIVCKSGEYVEIGNTDEGLYQFNIVIPFESEEIK